MALSSIQLGFCVPVESEDQLKLIGHRTRRWMDWDGGQIGGCPSWLTGTTPPANGPPICTVCHNAMAFVGQLYAPKDDQFHDEAYHRSLYIFGCSKDCTVSVLRCNMARENSYWPFDGEAEVDEYTSATDPSKKQLCVVCGFPALDIPCSGQIQPFCGRNHQRLQYCYDNYHKQYQTKTSTLTPDSIYQGVYVPMYELVVEEEQSGAVIDDDDDDGVVAGDQLDSDAYLEQADLNAALLGRTNTVDRSHHRDDEIMYEKFCHRIHADREQVIRYGGDSPLWMTAQCPDTIPPCDQCGKPRTFEFQLMPQLLHFLKQQDDAILISSSSTTMPDDDDDDGPLLTPEELEQSVKRSNESSTSVKATIDDRRRQLALLENKPELDWGVVAVYTCSESCPTLGSYIEEYAYVQPSIASINT